MFPYIIMKAKMERLMAHIKFVKIFEYSNAQMDAVSYAFSKLEICIELLMNFSGSNMNMSESDFEIKIHESDYENIDYFERQR